MCKVEERIYHSEEGNRTRSEEAFPCGEARNGKLCAKVKKRTTEYFPKKGSVASRAKNESSALADAPTPTGTGSYLVQQRRPDYNSGRPPTRDGPRVIKPVIIVEFGAKNKGKKTNVLVPAINTMNKQLPLRDQLGDPVVEFSGSEASDTIRTGISEVSLLPLPAPAFPELSWRNNLYISSDSEYSSGGVRSLVASTSDDESITASRQKSLYVTSDPTYPSLESRKLTAVHDISKHLEVAEALAREENLKQIGFELSLSEARAREIAEHLLIEMSKQREEARQERRKRNDNDGPDDPEGNPFEARPTRGTASTSKNPFSTPSPSAFELPVTVHQDPWDPRSLRDALPGRQRISVGRSTIQRYSKDLISATGKHSAFLNPKRLVSWKEIVNELSGGQCQHRDIRSFDGLRCCLACGEVISFQQSDLGSSTPRDHTAPFQELDDKFGEGSQKQALEAGSEPQTIGEIETEARTAQAPPETQATPMYAIGHEHYGRKPLYQGKGLSKVPNTSKASGFQVRQSDAKNNLNSVPLLIGQLPPPLVEETHDLQNTSSLEDHPSHARSIYRTTVKASQPTESTSGASLGKDILHRAIPLRLRPLLPNRPMNSVAGSPKEPGTSIDKPSQDPSEETLETETEQEANLHITSGLDDVEDKLRRYIPSIETAASDSEYTKVDTEDTKVDTEDTKADAEVEVECAEAIVATVRPNLSYKAWIDTAKRSTNAALVATGFLEPPLRESYTRLRWRCRCNETFFGDVREYHEGGTTKLIERMQRSMGTKVVATTHKNSTSNQRYIARVPAWFRSAVNKFSTALGRSMSSSPVLPLHASSGITSACAPSSMGLQQQQTLHLMACMQRGRYRRTVHQERIDEIATDKALFCFMQSQLARHRGRIRKMFSLKCVQGLYFVKFRLRACGSAEVRDHEPCCTSSTSKACECIPPAPKVEPAPDAEYRCDPAGPLDWWPPVLSQELMHMLTSPDCIDPDETFVLNQLPKRTKGELVGTVGRPAEGWGISFQEGWDFDLLIGIVLAVFLVASLLFAVLWSHFKLDVQGAFGVSSYMVTAIGIFVAWFANRAGKLA